MLFAERSRLGGALSLHSNELHFGTEFAAFLVAVAGISVVPFGRGGLPRSALARWLLTLGFGATAAAAFVNGSQLGGAATVETALVVRGVGTLLLALGSVSGPKRQAWTDSNASRLLWWFGLACQALSIGARFFGAPLLDSLVALDVADFAIAYTLIREGRKAVATRVATVTGVALLALVLVLSVALSAVVDATVRQQALLRLNAASRGSSAQVLTLAYHDLRGSAFLFDQLVEGYVGVHCPGAVGSAETRCIAGAVAAYSSRYFPADGVIWLSPTGQPIATSPNLATMLSPSETGILALQLKASVAARTNAATIGVLGHGAFAVASVPDIRAGGSGGVLVGGAVFVAPIDVAYLTSSRVADRAVSLAIASSSAVLARSGPGPAGSMPGLASKALGTGSGAQALVGNFYLSAAPLPALAGMAPVALIASEPDSISAGARDSLFGTLFLVALGGTMLALMMAGIAGERVGSGLRRLTAAAAAIKEGGAGVRAGIRSEDEVGTLSDAFDAMAESIEDQTRALSEAAADEARLRGRLEAIVAGMEEALVAVDGADVITDVNRAAEGMFGIDAASAVGRPFSEVIRLSHLPGVSAESDSAWLVTQGTGSIEVSFTRGTEDIPLSCSYGALGGRGAALEGAVFVFRDLRQEREIEKMKTEFLSRISHELRTPLTGIMGFASLLGRKDVPPERAHEWNSHILDQAKRIARTIELLEFVAASGAGRLPLAPSGADLVGMVEDIAGRWRENLGEDRVQIDEPLAGIPPVDVDRRWLTLAIDELIDNAAKFSAPNTPITLSVGLDPDGRSAHVVVRDRGKGMSNAEAMSAFGEFVQGDASDTRSYGGLGLGLVLVRRVAEGHGGKVTCDSAEGQGTALVIHLPLRSGTTITSA